MDAEITHLENQLEQLVALYESGKAEMRSLRTRVAALEAENRQLLGKVRLASEKLESLLQNLPES
ncbi:MAG: hypothetical protein KJZ96_05640 [Rhodocyclaceae bacterium]|nr:hypothetical protein [Rhodocyclaceae bacterium]MCL4757808.1 hypothetical protein [Rhodocyclaceae bacterium]